MQRLGIDEDVWARVESKNTKKKLLKAVRKGDDEELARRAAFLYQVLQGTWSLPPDLACLLAPSHDLYVPRDNAWGRARPPNPTQKNQDQRHRTHDQHRIHMTTEQHHRYHRTTDQQHLTNEYEYDYEGHDYSNEYASDAEEEWNLIA